MVTVCAIESIYDEIGDFEKSNVWEETPFNNGRANFGSVCSTNINAINFKIKDE